MLSDAVEAVYGAYAPYCREFGSFPH